MDTETKTLPASAQQPTTLNPYQSTETFEVAQRMAKSLASADFVPREFRENVANCLIAIEYANRLGSSPLPIMQSLYVVHGKPAFSASFLIGLINASPAFRGRMRFKLSGEGDDRECRAFAVDAETGAELEGAGVSVATARREGWYDRNGSKWANMTDQMLTYRAASFFARTYAPELALGMKTVDELIDVGGELDTVTISPTAAPAAPIGALLPAVDEPAAPPPGQPPEAPAEAPKAPAKPPEAPKRRPGDTARSKWPKAEETEAGRAIWVDSIGQIYDENAHAWSKAGQPAVTKKGVFRKARTTVAQRVENEGVASAPETPATASGDIPAPDAPPEPAGGGVPADASPTLRSLLLAVGQANDAEALNRLQAHPETAHFTPDELDFYRSAIQDKASTL